MFEQLKSFIFGSAKVETPRERIARLQALSVAEEKRTAELNERVEEYRRINALREKILNERKVQSNLFASLGVDSPQVKRRKQIRMYVYLGIALVVVFIIAKACIH